MKASPLLFALAAFGLTAPAARAGSAVATDHHGGFGYAYGARSERALQRQALARCREQSRYPEEAAIIASTDVHGFSVIMRYWVKGGQHVYAYVGAGSFEEARRRAGAGARQRGAAAPEIVAQWED